MNKISRAICFATEAFDGKKRKAENSPAIFHSLEAAAVVQSVCDDEDVICAAILHDTVEDAGIELSELQKRFGERVAFLVNSETEDKCPAKRPSDTWLFRKEKSLEELKQSTDIGIKAVWLGDKLSNLRSFSRFKANMGEKMWDSFNQKDPKAHKNYYQTIAKELSVFADTDAYIEFTTLIEKIFGEY